jgi:hypothetical protein
MVSQLAFQSTDGLQPCLSQELQTFGPMPVGLAAATMSLFSLLFFASCGGMTQLAPAAPSPLPSGSISNVTQPPVGPSLDRAIHGTVGPFDDEAPSCFADLFPCERFNFSLPHEGPIEVTLTWEGDSRALFVQLYWEGRWLAHEDVAPRGGASRIAFLRPKMEANDYELRIVSREPTLAIPFTLIVKY